MRLHRLQVQSFAAIRQLAVAFGPGLNVLYGPNDLGKSTLAEAIRLALLLPYNSAHCERFIPWSGGEEPVVELTFETEEQRIWRVRKQFGKRGSALLQLSRNGRDFEDVERARGVDARLREILCWGIPEPGGSGASRTFPASFLATALLSTQADVTNLLGGSLQDDPAATGKDRIAAALQAVAQDPLFVALLREVQGRRDEAYTDKGAKKRAQGSVLKTAADRVREAREEKERLEKIVEESRGAERRHQELVDERNRREQEHAAAEEHLLTVERLARQAAERDVAAERVRVAREAVQRIEGMDLGVAAAAQKLLELAGLKDQSERALREAQEAAAVARGALATAEEAARSAGLDSEMADTLARQELELRKVAVEQAEQAARQEIVAATAAQDRIDAAVRIEGELRRQEADTVRVQEAGSRAAEAEQAAGDALLRCDRLERALELRNLEKQVASARAVVEREATLRAEWTKASEDHQAAVDRRSAIVVPPSAALVAMRKLATELASAEGALAVGLVMTVIPSAIVNLRISKDGVAADPEVVAKPLEIEASREVEVEIADLATIRVRGGRREAQERAEALQRRWAGEVLPSLTAAGVADLEGLEAKMDEARDLDSRIQSLDQQLEALRRQIEPLAGVADALRDAAERVAACRLELGEAEPESLAEELDALGRDPAAALRARRQQASRGAEAARTAAREAGTAEALAVERTRNLQVSLDDAMRVRDAAMVPFPAGPAAAVEAAEEALRVAEREKAAVVADLLYLQRRIDERKERLDAELAEARTTAEAADRAVDAAQQGSHQAMKDHASEEGRLAELRRSREAENLAAAESRLREESERQDALPLPERLVDASEVPAARGALATAEQRLEAVDREVHSAKGALEQIGGAVARDHLRDATEALELRESLECELEADYEAWRLLLEQMKEAEAAQESNLGQALAPIIADHFQALTHQRYQRIQLTPHLGTEGIVVAGEVRPPDRISVGTREQLSTLYRLCLGEYLRTAVVLDDQLVQSDEMRMEWFRVLLAEKARSFQIVVFTCRPGDYLPPEEMVGEDGAAYLESGGGAVRAIDLGRAVGRHCR